MSSDTENINVDTSIDNEYNQEPVYYCRKCLSLNIQTIDSNSKVSGLDFCNNCGSTDIDKTDIFTWNEMCKKRFNH